MRNTSRRILGAFQIIGEVFDELRRGNGVRWGDSIRETIDESILTYRQEVERMNEKVERLERSNDNYM